MAETARRTGLSRQRVHQRVTALQKEKTPRRGGGAAATPFLQAQILALEKRIEQLEQRPPPAGPVPVGISTGMIPEIIQLAAEQLGRSEARKVLGLDWVKAQTFYGWSTGQRVPDWIEELQEDQEKPPVPLEEPLTIDKLVRVLSQLGRTHRQFGKMFPFHIVYPALGSPQISEFHKLLKDASDPRWTDRPVDLHMWNNPLSTAPRPELGIKTDQYRGLYFVSPRSR